MSSKVKEEIKRYLTLIVGLFLYAFAYNLFLKTNNLVTGDVDGIATIFKSTINPNCNIMYITSYYKFPPSWC